MTKKHIRLVYGIVLSIMLIVSGICLCAACIGIYNSGDRAFTRESVSAAFSEIAVPVYLCLALIVGGWILNGFLPAETKKLQPEKQYEAILAKLQGKLDAESCEPGLLAQIKKLQNGRKLHKLIGIILLVLGSIVFLSYGMNGNNFDQQDITGSMIKSMVLFLPCLAIPFGYGIFSAYHQRASLQKEITLTKEAIASGAQAAEKTNTQAASCGKATLVLRWVLLGIAVTILVYGFFAGGTNDVLTKAINICTECVGLG